MHERSASRGEPGGRDSKTKPLYADTPLKVERVWLDMIRAKDAAWRMERVAYLAHFAREATVFSLRRANPGATAAELDLRLLSELYGPASASAVVALRRKAGFYERHE